MQFGARLAVLAISDFVLNTVWVKYGIQIRCAWQNTVQHLLVLLHSKADCKFSLCQPPKMQQVLDVDALGRVLLSTEHFQ